MLDIKVDFSNLTRQFKKVRKDTMNVAAAVVEEEFVDMLYNAPQYSGNFVANMKIKAGARASGEGKAHFPAEPNLARVFQRGNAPAIQVALQENKGVRQALVGHVDKKRGWMQTVVISNAWKKASVIEDLNDSQLTHGGAHPLAKLKASMQARFSRTIEYGSPEWYRLLSRAPL